MADASESMQLQEMKTGEVADRARQAGVDDVEAKNKSELIEAMSGDPHAGQGGGQSAEDPAPEGADPSQYKDLPGNQS